MTILNANGVPIKKRFDPRPCVEFTRITSTLMPPPLPNIEDLTLVEAHASIAMLIDSMSFIVTNAKRAMDEAQP